MKSMKRTVAWLMTMMLIFSIIPSTLMMSAFASAFPDFPTGWSAPAVQAAIDNGLLRGKDNGLLEPEAKLTRAEAAAIINRAFGATVKANISSFTDVKTGDWFYSDVAKAVNMRTFVGVGNGLFNPDSSITREEMFTAIARALVLSDNEGTALAKFSDSANVSVYAIPYINALARNGYVNGNANGTLNPKGDITREEFAQVMHNIFKTYISKNGLVTSVNENDCVIIRVPNVTLKDVTIEKDLVLGDGVGAGDVTLNNVTVKGRLLVRGGEGTVDLINTKVNGGVVVNDYNGTVNFHNYRTESVFDGIILNTPATFLKRGGGGGSSTPSAPGGDDDDDDDKPAKAKFTFEASEDADGIVTINVKLDKLPTDITDLASLHIPYEIDAAYSKYLTFIEGKSWLEYSYFAATDKVIAWNCPVDEGTSTSKPVTTLPGDNILFTLKFKNEGVRGEAVIKFGDMEVLSSAGKKSEEYEKVDGKIPLNQDPKLYFVAEEADDVVTLKVKLTQIPTDVSALASMHIPYIISAEHKDYLELTDYKTFLPKSLFSATKTVIAWVCPYDEGTKKYTPVTELPEDNVLFELTFKNKGASGTATISFGDVEIKGTDKEAKAYKLGDPVNVELSAASNTYTVKVYSGVRNIVSGTNYGVGEGVPFKTLEVDKNTKKLNKDKITPLNEEGNDKSFTDEDISYLLSTEKGYTNSKSELHIIERSLMKKVGDTFEDVVFDENGDIVVDGDLVLAYMNKTLELRLKNTKLSSETFIARVPYDSNSAIGETLLDAMAYNRTYFKTLYPSLPNPYSIMVDKLSERGFVDASGNILAKALTIDVSEILTKEHLDEMIDNYIRTHLSDDDFVATFLSNNLIRSLLDNNIELKNKLIKEYSSEIVENPTFFKSVIEQPGVIDKVVEEAVPTFINDAAKFKDYVVTNKLTIVDGTNPTLHDLVIDEAVKFVTEEYIEKSGNDSDPLITYITSLLKTQAVIDEILTHEDDLKIAFKGLLKDMIEDESNIDETKEIFIELLDDDSLQEAIRPAIKGDGALKAQIKTDMKDEIKAAAETTIKDDIRYKVKDSIKSYAANWILDNVEDNSVWLYDIKTPIADKIEEIIYNDHSVRVDVDESEITADLVKKFVKGESITIQGQTINGDFDLVYDSVYDSIYDTMYPAMYDAKFDEFYNDSAIFTDDIFTTAYEEFVDGADFFTELKAFIEAKDANFSLAFDVFKKNTDTYYDAFVSTDGNFEKLFERYYKNNVRKAVKTAYGIKEVKPLITDKIKKYTEDIVVKYAKDTFKTPDEDELKKQVTKFIEEDMHTKVTTKYNDENETEFKSELDSLISENVKKLIDQYANDDPTLSTENKTMIEDEIKAYVEKLVDDYVNNKLSDDMKEFVDDTIYKYVNTMVTDFENGTDGGFIRKLIDEYGDEAVDAYEHTPEYRALIDNFEKGYVLVNKDSVELMHIVSDALKKVKFEDVKADLDPKIQKVLDLIGDGLINKYIEEARTSFVTGLDAKIAEVDAAPEGSTIELKQNTTFTVHINAVKEIVMPAYNKAMAKVTAKVNSMPELKADKNAALNTLINKNLLEELFFEPVGDEYKLRTDIMATYDKVLELSILAHDAVVWYGDPANADADAMASAAALIVAGYANKVNEMVMNYITNGELPGGLTLDQILDFNGKIEEYYYKYEDKIEKLMDKYEQYMDRDYEIVFDKVVNGKLNTKNDGAFDVVEILAETKVFDVDALYSAALDGVNFAENDKVQKVVNKIKSYISTPVHDLTKRHYVDCYKATLYEREIKGRLTGDTTVEVMRYLK